MTSPLSRVQINKGNREPRQALLLLIDTSSSMGGMSIDAVNEGVQTLQRLLRDPEEPTSKRVEVAVVTFGESVSTVQDFVEVARFEASPLDVSGFTPMGEAIRFSLGMVEERKALYRREGLEYFRPWIFLITDGEPTDEWQSAADAVHRAEAESRVAFYAVGTESANFATLARIASPGRTPLRLKDGKWKEMFQWLSRSMQLVSRSKPGEQVPLETPAGPTGWGEVPKPA